MSKNRPSPQSVTVDRPRVFAHPITPGELALDRNESRHLLSALRAKVGDTVELFDGKGTVAQATILSTHGKQCQLSIEPDTLVHHPPRRHSRVVLAVSIPKGERFDRCIGQCTELGIDTIMPVIYERTVKQLRGEKSLERYVNVAISSAKQSRSLFLPTILPPMSLGQAIQQLSNDYPAAYRLYGGLGPQAVPYHPGAVTARPATCPATTSDALPADNQGHHSPERQTVPPPDTIAFVGPEGGFTPAEERCLQEHDAKPIRLTETILRIETAALAFAVLLTTHRDARNQ